MMVGSYYYCIQYKLKKLKHSEIIYPRQVASKQWNQSLNSHQGFRSAFNR